MTVKGSSEKGSEGTDGEERAVADSGVGGTAVPGPGGVRGARWGWGLLQQLNLGAERHVYVWHMADTRHFSVT